MTDTLMVALQEARAACDDSAYADVLLWLDEIEAELDGRPSPAEWRSGDAQAKLAAWNAWAAQ